MKKFNNGLKHENFWNILNTRVTNSLFEQIVIVIECFGDFIQTFIIWIYSFCIENVNTNQLYILSKDNLEVLTDIARKLSLLA